MPVHFAQHSVLVLITLGHNLLLRNLKGLQALHHLVINCHYHAQDKGLDPGEIMGADGTSRNLKRQCAMAAGER